MDMHQLDPKAKSMWRVTRLIGLFFIILCDVGIFFIILKNIEALSTVTLFLILLLPVAIQVLNIVFYPAVEYRQWTYLITGDRIEIKKGIFFHSTRVIPISRIQHVTIVEGPIARLFGLATVTISTAGGAFRIEGLSKATAAAICDNLKDVVNRKIGIR